MNKKEIKGDHHRISPTARMVAYLRSFSDIPYAKEASIALKGEEAAREILKEDFYLIEDLAPMVEARYKCFDQLLKKAKNVLELAMGTSIERGLSLTEKPEIIYVGTDLPDMVNDSIRFFNAVSPNKRENHHLQAANVLNYGELESACRYYKGRKDITIIHEGLWQYLTPQEQELATVNIKKILLKYGGKWATPDIMDKQSRNDFFASLNLELRAAMPRIMQKIKESTGRSIGDNAFSTKEETLNFFHKHGFNVSEYPSFKGYNEISSVKNLKWSSEKKKIYEPIFKRNVLVMELK